MVITLTSAEVKQAVANYIKASGCAVVETGSISVCFDNGECKAVVDLDQPNKPVPPAPDYPRAIDTKVTLEEHELLTKDRQWEGGRIVYPNKIEVIKQVRHRTGGGLKESKDLVDKYVMEIEN